MLKNKILAEVKKEGLVANSPWVLNRFYPFRSELASEEKEIFDSIMDELCEQGVFKKDLVNGHIIYTLTSKGAEIIYS